MKTLLTAMVITLSFAASAKTVKVQGNIPVTVLKGDAGYFIEEFWGADQSGRSNDNFTDEGRPVCSLRVVNALTAGQLKNVVENAREGHTFLASKTTLVAEAFETKFAYTLTRCTRYVRGSYDPEYGYNSVCVEQAPIGQRYTVSFVAGGLKFNCEADLELEAGRNAEEATLLDKISHVLVIR